MAYGSINADSIVTSVSGGVLGGGNASIMKNRIINGAMVIDQRNAGAASANTINGYFLDRWYINQGTTGKIIAQQNAGSVTPPAGFSNYLGITSQSAYTISATDVFMIYQNIEGFNSADLDFGKSTAKTVTISFWVRSSLTGTFGGALGNGSANRTYPFTYTISAANTWEQKSVTIVGDTTGTWTGATNGNGMRLMFGYGVGSTYSATAGSWTGGEIYGATGATSVVGTNGATFYITGVQLEVGSSATGFEYVNYQTSLANCQRYYQTYAQPSLRGVISTSTAAGRMGMVLPVVMRSSPSAVVGSLPIFDGSNTGTVSSVAASYLSTSQVEFDFSLSNSSYTLGRAACAYQSGSTTLTLSAEL